MHRRSESKTSKCLNIHVLVKASTFCDGQNTQSVPNSAVCPAFLIRCHLNGRGPLRRGAPVCALRLLRFFVVWLVASRRKKGSRSGRPKTSSDEPQILRAVLIESVHIVSRFVSDDVIHRCTHLGLHWLVMPSQNRRDRLEFQARCDSLWSLRKIWPAGGTHAAPVRVEFQQTQVPAPPDQGSNVL